MIASWISGSYLKAIATVEWSLPVFRPAWTSSQPHPRRYSGSGSRKTTRARRPGRRRIPRSGFALRPTGCDPTEFLTDTTSEPETTPDRRRRLLQLVRALELAENGLPWLGPPNSAAPAGTGHLCGGRNVSVS